MSRPAAFLDRDGVLDVAPLEGGKPGAPRRVDELELVPGAAEALGRLRSAGFLVVVVTNQPDARRGRTTQADLEAINEAVAAALPIDQLRACYHDTPDGCGCRKPKPGLLLEAAADLDVDLAASTMVGDRWSDLEAGRQAGCGAVVLVGDGYGEAGMATVQPDVAVPSVVEAVAWILDRGGG